MFSVQQPSEISIFEALLLFGFLLMFVVQLYFYVRYFLPLAKFKNESVGENHKAVSIVIAARNEEKTILKLIDHLLTQKYIDFEIIVVNDYSTDDTLKMLRDFEGSKLKVINNDGKPGKKSAISRGIFEAKHELLLFTDADCWPNSENWIAEMTSGFTNDIEIVLGFGAFEKTTTLLNKLTRFEGFISALQYFGFAHAGKVYMGVGRNLAYRKSTFLKVDGFSAHENILSGDDDLLVNKASTSSNVAIQLHANAQTVTKGETSWERFIYQKRRQLTAGAYYKQSDKIRLAVFGATSFLYYMLFGILLLNSPFSLLIFVIFVTKQALEYLLFRGVAKRLKVQDLMPLLVVLEPLYIFSITAIGISTWFWKVKEWK
jgi:glycosyltransferase involved in cell wall biosynthesis